MLTVLLLLVYISFMSIGLQNSLLGAAWPSMYESLGVPLSYMGIISLIITGFTIVSSMLSGKLIKSFEPGTIIFSGILMIAAALFGFCIFSNFILLCVLAVPLGLGIGSADSVLNNVAATHFKLRHNNWLHCTWALGASLGPIAVSEALSRTGSWKTGYLSIGFILIAVFIVLAISMPLWKKLPKQIQPETEKNRFGLTELVKLKGMKQTLVVFFCYCAIETTVGLWGSSYLVVQKSVTPELAARWISLYFLGITIGRFLSGFLTFKLNNRFMVRLGYAVFALGIASMLLPIGKFAYISGFFVMGLGLAPIFPCLIHLTPKIFGNEYSQGAVGMQIAGASIGATIVPPLFGVIAGRFGYGCFYSFLIVLLAVMTYTIEALNKKVYLRGES